MKGVPNKITRSSHLKGNETVERLVSWLQPVAMKNAAFRLSQSFKGAQKKRAFQNWKNRLF